MKAQQITSAFAQAAQKVNKTFSLKGRGYTPRVCLQVSVSRYAAPSLEQGKHFDIVCVGNYKTCGPRRVFALEIVEAAASILGCQVNDLTTPNYQN